MARKRYQNGSLNLVGNSWEARWWEDVEGSEKRKYPSKVIGTIKDFPTKSLAQKEFRKTILDRVNSLYYKPVAAYSFNEFVVKWKASVMSQFKPSSQRSIGCEIKHLTAHFGEMRLAGITAESVQKFVAASSHSPKYTKNLIADFRMVWNTARAWGYVSHDPLFGVRLPKVEKRKAPSFTIDEIQRIMAEAQEPFRTMYWIAGALGLRAGEICGLHVRDLNFTTLQLSVSQSSWEGKLQSPKSGNAIRTFSMSRELAHHLKTIVFGKSGAELVFSKNGKPYRQDGIAKYNLWPILKRLGIARAGLHAFRHANVTIMDQLNAPAAVRMARIGHGDLGTTMGYTHLVSADDQRIAQQIDEKLLTKTVQ